MCYALGGFVVTQFAVGISMCRECMRVGRMKQLNLSLYQGDGRWVVIVRYDSRQWLEYNTVVFPSISMERTPSRVLMTKALDTEAT